VVELLLTGRQKRLGLGQNDRRLRADAEITRLLEPENTAVSVNQDRRGDCEIAKRAAFRREFAVLDSVLPMNDEPGICQQGDVPIVLLFERPQLIDTIGAERHELDAERGELFRGFVELFQLGDAVGAPVTPEELQQHGRSAQIRKTERHAIGIDRREIRRERADAHRGLPARQTAGGSSQQEQRGRNDRQRAQDIADDTRLQKEGANGEQQREYHQCLLPPRPQGRLVALHLRVVARDRAGACHEREAGKYQSRGHVIHSSVGGGTRRASSAQKNG
jgi:hypothetical protein